MQGFLPKKTGKHSSIPLRVVLVRPRTQDGRVRQTVALSVAASPTSGYRTFSRQSVSRGAWTVAVVGRR